MFEELGVVEVLNNEDSKLEGFDGTGSWCLIFPYICYYVTDTFKCPFYANLLFFTGNHTSKKS